MPDQTLTAEQKAILAEAQQYGGTLAPMGAAPISVAPATPTPAQSWLDSAKDVISKAANGYGEGSGLGPATIYQSLKSLYGEMQDHPVETAILGPGSQLLKMIGASQLGELKQAKDAYDKGDYAKALGHTMFGLTPAVGPALGAGADDIARGEVARGVGSIAGTLTGPALVGGAKALAAPALDAAAQSVAGTADAAAAAKMAKVLAPRGGPNALRFGDMAEEAAPQAVRDPALTAKSFDGLQDQLQAAKKAAGEAVGQVYNSRPTEESFPTAPVKAAIQAKIAELQPKGFEKVPRGIDTTKGAMVTDTMPDGALTSQLPGAGTIWSPTSVEPAMKASRLATLRTALDEVSKLGDEADAKNLHQLTKDWSVGAKPKYLANNAADALKSQGEASGWQDADQIMRGYLADKVPDSAAAAAKYSYAAAASDAMDAARDLARTKAGGTQMTGLIGTIASKVLPEGAVQIRAARSLAALADTLKAYKAGTVQAGAVQGAALMAAHAAGLAPQEAAQFINPFQQKDQ